MQKKKQEKQFLKSPGDYIREFGNPNAAVAPERLMALREQHARDEEGARGRSDGGAEKTDE